MTTVLTERELNRATLARQMLLRRDVMPAAKAIEHLVGLQAQAVNPPYVGLWSRLAGFRHEHLGDLVASRRAVRIALMRSTIHLVTARDCLALYPILRPVQERSLFKSTAYGRRLEGLDLEALVRYGRELLEERPRTLTELRLLLAGRWPDFDAQSMAYGLRNLLPLVQVPPRGVWGGSGPPACTTADHWIGRPIRKEGRVAVLLLRYLGAFGPASVRDAQVWSGLSGLAAVLDPLRRRLRVFRSERGAELFDLPEAPRPPAETPAPVRFLPEFDNLLLSYADRSRLVSDAHRRRLGALNGMVPGTLLLDGRVAGTWRVERGPGRTATLRIHTFTRVPRTEKDAVVAEGTELTRFVATAAERFDVRFSPMRSL